GDPLLLRFGPLFVGILHRIEEMLTDAAVAVGGDAVVGDEIFLALHRIIVHELYADKQEIGGGHRDEEGAADRADGGDDVHDDDEIDGDDVNRKHLGALFFQARAAEAHRPAHGH